MPNGLRATPGSDWMTLSASPCVPGTVRTSSVASVRTVTSLRERSPRTTAS